MRHINDRTSVCAWVKEFQTLPYNPIIIFKPQGETQSDKIDNIGKKKIFYSAYKPNFKEI